MAGKEPDADNDNPSRFLDDLLDVLSFSDWPRDEVKDEIGDQRATGTSSDAPIFIKASADVNATVATGQIATTTTLTPDWFGRRISAFTLLLVACTALFTGLQWHITEDTYQQIRNQTIATQDAAVGAISSAATANQSLLASQKEFQTDHRPYLVAETPSFIVNGVDYTPLTPGAGGSYIEAQFSVNNAGRTPAKSYYVSSHLYLYTSPPIQGSGEVAEKAAVKDMTGFLDSKFAELQKVLIKARKNGTVWITGGDLAPSVSVVYTSQTEPNFFPIRIATEDEARKLRTSESLLFYIGRIEYGDLFTKEIHSTEFCFRYFGDARHGAWHACEWRNSIL